MATCPISLVIMVFSYRLDHVWNYKSLHINSKLWVSCSTFLSYFKSCGVDLWFTLTRKFEMELNPEYSIILNRKRSTVQVIYLILKTYLMYGFILEDQYSVETNDILDSVFCDTNFFDINIGHNLTSEDENTTEPALLDISNIACENSEKYNLSPSH